jgi:hypothetical protein
MEQIKQFLTDENLALFMEWFKNVLIPFGVVVLYRIGTSHTLSKLALAELEKKLNVSLSVNAQLQENQNKLVSLVELLVDESKTNSEKTNLLETMVKEFALSTNITVDRKLEIGKLNDQFQNLTKAVSEAKALSTSEEILKVAEAKKEEVTNRLGGYRSKLGKMIEETRYEDK